MAHGVDELAASLAAFVFTEIGQSLHQVADRFQQFGRGRAGPHVELPPESDAEFTTGSGHPRHPRNRGTPQAFHHINHPVSDPPNNHSHGASRPAQRHYEVAAHPDDNPSSALLFGQGNLSIASSPNHTEPRARHRPRADGLVRGRVRQPYDPPSVSSTPSPRVSFQQRHEPVPISADRGDQSTAQPLLSPEDVFPAGDDIYDLDETLVRCQLTTRTPWIYCPPRGQQGSQGRWYYVTQGTQVGIFNEWSEVKEATCGVSGAHQQRVDTEELAYIFFKRALEARGVLLVG